MIKANKKKVQIKGNPLALTKEFSHIVKALKDAMVKSGIGEETVKGILDRAFSLGTMSEDEVREEAMRVLREALSKITEEEEDSNE